MSNVRVWSPGFSRSGAHPNRLKAGLQTWSLVIGASLVIGHWSLAISRRLPPLILPITHIILTAGSAIRSHGHHVVGSRIMFAGALVNIWMPPGVIGNFTFQVRPAPALRIARWLNEIDEAAFSLGIISIVHLESIQRGAENSNLRYGRRLLGLLGPAGELRHNDRRKNPEDHQHQQQF